MAVVEIYTVKSIDNSRLNRRRSGGFQRACRKQLAVAAVLALALIAYTWQRYECLELNYQAEQLGQRQSQVSELNRQLRVELATLRSPARIDLLARNQLGMVVAQPTQIIQVEPQTAGEVADAGTTANPAGLR